MSYPIISAVITRASSCGHVTYSISVSEKQMTTSRSSLGRFPSKDVPEICEAYTFSALLVFLPEVKPPLMTLKVPFLDLGYSCLLHGDAFLSPQRGPLLLSWCATKFFRIPCPYSGSFNHSCYDPYSNDRVNTGLDHSLWESRSSLELGRR